jgi:methylthioribulose-1-phosphate dehydratase
VTEPIRVGKTKAANPNKLANELAETGRALHARAWALGTSGNYSAVLRAQPLKLLITSSGVDKAQLSKHHFLHINHNADVLRGDGRPSAESLLHVAVARARGAKCILHTHSVWSTILSDRHAANKSLAIRGYEMLKGLEGVKTHEHQEWIPIFENSQDIPALAKEVEALLKQDQRPHGFLLRGHGLYTWGEDVAQARRHVEIFEFLLEVVGRRELAEHAG